MRTQNAVPAARPVPGTQTGPGPQPGASVSSDGPREGLSQVTGAFRIPARPRTGPRLSRLAVVCGWAALIGLLGVAIGIRGLFALLMNHPPHWYRPTLIALGLGGIVVTAAALVTVQRRYVPWALLILSSGGLIAGLIATAMAT